MKEGDNLEDLGADMKVENIILKPMLIRRAWTAFFRLRTVIRTVAACE